MPVAIGGQLEDIVQIEDPEFYADDPFPIFERMRREAPVFWYAPLDTWVLTKYDDIRHVGKSPAIFSNTDGILLNDIRHRGVIQTFFGKDAELISTTDPPRHRELRRYLSPSFTPGSIKQMEGSIRDICRELIDTIVPGQSLDFVNQIGAILPLKAIALLMGIPGDNLADLKYWSDEMIKMGAALDQQGLLACASNTEGMRAYLDEWMVRSLGRTDSQLIPALVAQRLSGESLSYDNMHMFLRSVLVAGNETTRDFLSGSIWSYAQHPAQRAKLAADPTMGASAGEECLRWVTPVRGFIRTAAQDTELRGQRIRKGQHVHMMWMAANRDEEIWEDAGSFEISRKPEPMHLAFGFGEHACVGAALARLEGRVFFEELMQRYPNWDLAGDPLRPHSVLHNSFEELPVVFSDKR
jgi:cytochrome P450